MLTTIYLQKNRSNLVYCGLKSAVSQNDTPIGGSHPMLYFPIQITEKYSIVLCYQSSVSGGDSVGIETNGLPSSYHKVPFHKFPQGCFLKAEDVKLSLTLPTFLDKNQVCVF